MQRHRPGDRGSELARQTRRLEIQKQDAQQVSALLAAAVFDVSQVSGLGSLAVVDADGSSSEVILGDGTKGSVPTHTHAGDELTIDGSGWSGTLAGSGITTAQELADWIDANL